MKRTAFKFRAALCCCLAMAGLPLLSGCSDDLTNGLDVKMPENISADDKKMMQDALDALVMNCRHLRTYKDDLTDAKATLLPASEAKEHGFNVSMGWGRMVQLKLTVKADASVPKKWQANGKTLTWTIGGGAKPGVHMNQPEAAKFCDLNGTDVTLLSKRFNVVK